MTSGRTALGMRCFAGWRGDGNCAPQLPVMNLEALGREVQVGDVLFTRIAALPFRKVAAITGSWTNHVGVIVEKAGPVPIIAESKFPRSRLSSLAEFVARSQGGRVALAKLKAPPPSGDA